MLAISTLIYFVAESPLFLLSRNKIKEFRKVINYIAKVNNRKITENFKKDFQKYIDETDTELLTDSNTILTSDIRSSNSINNGEIKQPLNGSSKVKIKKYGLC